MEGHKGENFQKNFFCIFLFQMTQFAKKSKKKFLKIFDFLWAQELPCPLLTLFDPYLGNQSFFGHAVFCKWFITLRRFFYQHLNKIVRAVFSQKSKKHCFYCFWALFAPKWGIRSFWGKSGSVTFFHLYSPNFMQINSQSSVLAREIQKQHNAYRCARVCVCVCVCVISS